MLENIAAFFSIGWKKWSRQMTAILFVALLTITGLFLAPPTPASAAPVNTPNTSTTQDQPTETEEETPTDSTEEANQTDCNTQLGAIGWAICPTTGSIAKAIDNIYSSTINFIKVNPLTAERNSATFLVWEYAKSITNIVFIIFILVIIFSQITGLGINSYGIKKSLPRIIVTAILVNLSFIICTLAVDISNILGYSVNGFFTGITETVASSTTADIGALANLTWDELIGGIITGGTLAGVSALTIAGGLGGLIWIALPAVLGAFIAVIAAFLTLAARQALVTVLVMISPLAIVAYLLPNTESLFKKWRDLLLKLLIFFPTFSLLFGASKLAGWAIISSSGGDGWVLILGMAVQIFPLIFAPTLLKMSGTILGTVNEMARKPFAPAQAALTKTAAERRAYHASKHMAKNTTTSAALRNFMNNRRTRRLEHTAKFDETNKLRGQAFTAASVYDKDGKLTRRGERLYNLIGENQESKKQILATENDFKKGLNPDQRARSEAQRDRIKANNTRIVSATDLLHAEQDRTESIKREDAVDFARRIRAVRDGNNEKLEKELAAIMSRSAENPDQAKERLSNLFASAQHAKNRADGELTDKYSVLFADTEYTDLIDAAYKATFESKNYNLATAALKELFTRGDVNLIEDDLMEYSHMLQAEGNLPMQKAFNDVLIKYKGDDARLSQFAKSNNIRRAKNFEWQKRFENFVTKGAGSGKDTFASMEHAREEYIADYADYEEYFGEKAIERTIVVDGQEYSFTEDTANVAKDLSMYNLVSTINDPYIVTTQDRNVFKWAYKRAVKNNADVYDPSALSGFNKAQYIRGFSSGRMDGEQLENMTMLLTGGFNSTRTNLNQFSDAEREYFNNHKEDITAYLTSQLTSMTGQDLSGMKTVAFFAYDNALMAANSNPEDIVIGPDGERHSKLFIESLRTATNSINRTANLRGATKPAVKAVLGITD